MAVKLTTEDGQNLIEFSGDNGELSLDFKLKLADSELVNVLKGITDDTLEHTLFETAVNKVAAAKFDKATTSDENTKEVAQ